MVSTKSLWIFVTKKLKISKEPLLPGFEAFRGPPFQTSEQRYLLAETISNFLKFEK